MFWSLTEIKENKMIFNITKPIENKVSSLQDQFLLQLMRTKHLVDVYLVNSIRLRGFIVEFDNYTIALTRSLNVEDILFPHLIFKHTISTIGCST